MAHFTDIVYEAVMADWNRHRKQFALTNRRRHAVIVRNSRSSGNTSPLSPVVQDGDELRGTTVVIRKEVNTQDAIARQPGASCDAAGLTDAPVNTEEANP